MSGEASGSGAAVRASPVRLAGSVKSAFVSVPGVADRFALRLSFFLLFEKKKKRFVRSASPTRASIGVPGLQCVALPGHPPAFRIEREYIA